MKNNTRKILLALLLVLTMMVSLVTIGVSAADEGTKVYLTPNGNWKADNARFAVYTWNDSGNAWFDMVDSDDDGIYEATIPAGNTKVIFCRMNANTTENTWENKWDQTVDLTLPANGNNHFTINEGDWNNANGTWSLFGSTVETPVEPDNGETPVDPTPGEGGGETTETLTGDFYLVGYINNADYGIEADSANLGIYKFVDGSITVNFTNDSYVLVKTGENVFYYFQSYTQTKSGTLYNASTGAGEKMFVPAGQVTFTLAKGEGDTLVLSYAGGNSGSTPNVPVTPTEPAENPIQPVDGYYKIYIYNTAWWDVVAYYTWNDAGEVRAEWPGNDVYEDTYLLYPVMIPAEYSYVIFNNGNDVQTGDIGINTIDQSKIVYNNGTGEWMALEDYDPSVEVDKPEIPAGPDFSQYETIRVYLGDKLNWYSANWYAWGTIDGVHAQNGNWPGLPMEYDDATGFYYADVPSCFDKIIFNDGSNQTADLAVPVKGSEKVVCDNSLCVGTAGGSTTDADPWFTIADFPAIEEPVAPEHDVTVVLKNDKGWSEVYFYYWDGDSTIEWPGTAMELGEDGLYYGVVPAGTLYVLFHNGGSWEDGSLQQSADLLVPTDKYVLYNNVDGQWHYFEVEGEDVVDPDPNKPDTDNKDEGETEEENKTETEKKPTTTTKVTKRKLSFWEKLVKMFKEFFDKIFGGNKKK